MPSNAQFEIIPTFGAPGATPSVRNSAARRRILQELQSLGFSADGTAPEVPQSEFDNRHDMAARRIEVAGHQIEGSEPAFWRDPNNPEFRNAPRRADTETFAVGPSVRLGAPGQLDNLDSNTINALRAEALKRADQSPPSSMAAIFGGKHYIGTPGVRMSAKAVDSFAERANAARNALTLDEIGQEQYARKIEEHKMSPAFIEAQARAARAAAEAAIMKNRDTREQKTTDRQFAREDRLLPLEEAKLKSEVGRVGQQLLPDEERAMNMLMQQAAALGNRAMAGDMRAFMALQALREKNGLRGSLTAEGVEAYRPSLSTVLENPAVRGEVDKLINTIRTNNWSLDANEAQSLIRRAEAAVAAAGEYGPDVARRILAEAEEAVAATGSMFTTAGGGAALDALRAALAKHGVAF